MKTIQDGILSPGNKYNVERWRCVGWVKHGSPITADAYDGYNYSYYFDDDGIYLGPDEFGVEPLLEEKPE